MASNSESDLLFFDVDRADELAQLMVQTSHQLLMDSFSISRILDEATVLLQADARAFGSGDPDLRLQGAAREVEDLAREIHQRVASVRRHHADRAQLGSLSARIIGWDGPPHDLQLLDTRTQRHTLLLSLLDGDVLAARLVGGALDRGLSYPDALDAVHAQMVINARADGLVDAFGITATEAQEWIVRIDLDVLRVQDLGYSLDEAEAAVSLAVHYSTDLDKAIAYAQSTNTNLIESMGKVIASQGLGVTAAEFDALTGLTAHFSQLDRLPGSGITNDKVTIADLEYIVANECRFADSQVFAAAALLANPELINRLDTARDNDDILGPERFGDVRPGDGVISLDDLEAFMYKAQLTHILSPFVDQIDIATNPAGVIDGIYSRRDLEAFLADASANTAPESVTAALTTAIDNGWFDQNWFHQHREELAYAAAMVAGGTVVFVSGGLGAPVLVFAGVAGGTAAGATVMAVNAITDNELTNGLAHGVTAGVIIGVSSASMVHSAGTATTATGTHRTAATVKAAAEATGLVSAGATDILMPEDIEESVKEVAGIVNKPLVGASIRHSKNLTDLAGPAASEIVFE
ncbi:MAG: hypothetical protein HOJ56_11910 [Acidimicrobiaceae bacterium]|nr:hypothetical protein [Acidimicrobiaceae bacterium]